MKRISLLLIIFSLYTILISGQNVNFIDRSDLLKHVTGFATYSDCVGDMNGDYQDDVVRVGEKGIFIDYQQPDGSYLQEQFNFPLLSVPSWSICVGDLDNNGYNDMLFANSTSVSFIMAKDNGTAYAEMLMPDSIECQRSTLADINNDGWLDGFVCNEIGENVPYRNMGDGNMQSDSSLIRTSNLVGNYAAVWTDYDNDGDIDLYISKCWVGALPGDSVRTNLLYRNNNDGTFTEVAGPANANDNAQSWSTVFEDFDNDGDFDAFIVNHDFANRLLRNNGDGTFTDVIQDSGIDSQDLTGYETFGGDFNNDGNIDLFTDLGYALYIGNGDMTFTGQEILFTPGSISDLNNDGSLDVYQDGKIWMNEGNDHHWIKVNTLGIVSNKNGIGARIEIYGAWGKKVREVRSGQGYSPMNSLTTHFGIGTVDRIDSLIVKWPSGIISELYDLPVDTTFIIPESDCLLPLIEPGGISHLKLCPDINEPILAPAGFHTYQWSNGDTTQFTFLNNMDGIYYVIVGDSFGCKAIAHFANVEFVVDTTPPQITAYPGIRFCEGDTVMLTSTAGLNYVWSTGETGVQSIQVFDAGEYTVTIDDFCLNELVSKPVELIQYGAQSCPIPIVIISETDSAVTLPIGCSNIQWYDQLTGGTLLHIGDSIQLLPPIMSDTLYIETHYLYSDEQWSGGKMDTAGQGGLPLQNGDLQFEVWEPFILNSVDVYVPVNGPHGIRFVELVSGDSVLAVKSFTVIEGKNVLDLDFFVPAGKFVLRTNQGNLFRNTGPLLYPYPIGDAGQITGSSNGEDYYYYFYNWQITIPGRECISEREPIYILVTSVSDSEKNEIRVYPNPVHGNFIVERGEMSPVTVRIINLIGQSVFERQLRENESVVSMDDLMPGSYLIQCFYKGKLYSQPIIVQ